MGGVDQRIFGLSTAAPLKEPKKKTTLHRGPLGVGTI